MNYKRGRTTSRRENHRIENKSARQAEQQALRGDKLRAPRSLGWSASSSNREDHMPLLDTSTKVGKRKKKKKNRYCPAREGNKRHEYLEDFEEHTVPAWTAPWETRYAEYTVRRYFKLCVHCGHEKTSRGLRRMRKRF